MIKLESLHITLHYCSDCRHVEHSQWADDSGKCNPCIRRHPRQPEHLRVALQCWRHRSPARPVRVCSRLLVGDLRPTAAKRAQPNHKQAGHAWCWRARGRHPRNCSHGAALQRHCRCACQSPMLDSIWQPPLIQVSTQVAQGGRAGKSERLALPFKVTAGGHASCRCQSTYQLCYCLSSSGIDCPRAGLRWAPL